MRLIDNPFYILDVSTTDNRQTIISKAEEKSFFEDSSVCSEAQNILLNIIKRTSAELSWFPGTDNLKIREICNSIKNNQTIRLSGLDSVARLNACVHNFSIQTHEDVYETGYSVLEIDELFESLDVVEVTDIINNDRQKAGIKEISENDVLSEIQKIREYISHVITEKVQSFPNKQRIDFHTLIAEKCIADSSYNDGVIIEDIINQYEIFVQSMLELKETGIRKLINDVRLLISGERNISNIGQNISYDECLQKEIRINVDAILHTLKDWDVYAQPIQLRDTARGYINTNSQKLANEIRDLGILIYNEKGYTEISLKISKILKSVFAELPEFVDKVSNDERILNENKAQEALDKLREQNRQVAVAQQQKRNFGSNLIGCLSPFAGFAILIVIILIIAGLSECSSDSNDSSSKSSKPSSSYSGGTNNYYDYDDYDYTPSQSYDSGNSVKANQLKSELEDLKDEIEDMEWDLDQLKDDIDYYERQYYNTGYDFYINYYDDAVDDYNDLYDEYEAAIDEYNDKVNEYNRLIGAN